MAVIDIVRFRLRDGVDEMAFRAINERFQQEVAPALPGLERREATRTEDGEWVLILRYRDADSAARAMGSDTSDVSSQLISMLDMSSMSATHAEIISE
ncbi:MAG: hypothetical protein ABIR11_03290 [Candidatus Limnocylindrales bacterium]